MHFYRDKPMLILYEMSNVDELKHYKNNQVKAVCVKPKSMFGHHHTYIISICYLVWYAKKHFYFIEK